MFDHFVGLQLKALTLSFLKRIAEFMLLDRFRERETETEIERDRHRETERDRTAL